MPRQAPNHPSLVTAIGLYLMVAGVVLVSALVELWPVVEQSSPNPGRTESPRTVGVIFGLLTLSLTRESSILVLVLVVSALGGFVHASTSFVDYVGNRRLASSWAWWYLLRLGIGMALALLLYFAVRGGFMTADASSGDVNPYGVAALAGLAGLFSKQATDKLREVFETLFRVGPGSGDEQRKDALSNPRPVITVLEPREATARQPGFLLRVLGEGFVADSVVRLDRVDQPTTFRSSSELLCEVPVELLEEDSQVTVAVFTPEPGGGTSPPSILTVGPLPASTEALAGGGG